MAFSGRLGLFAAAEGPEALPLLSWVPGTELCRFGKQEGLYCRTESLWLALCGWACALTLGVGTLLRFVGFSGGVCATAGQDFLWWVCSSSAVFRRNVHSGHARFLEGYELCCTSSGGIMSSGVGWGEGCSMGPELGKRALGRAGVWASWTSVKGCCSAGGYSYPL